MHAFKEFALPTSSIQPLYVQAMHAFKDVYLISALNQKGLPELRDFLVQQAQPGAWKLDATDFTDQWPEDVALEVRHAVKL